METRPIMTVDTVGVRKRGWIFENDDGSALYTAIDSVVRAVGKIVVCVEAAAEDRIIRKSNRVKNPPNPDEPKIALPSGENTSPWWSGLASPTPLAPIPANDWTE